MKIMRRRIVCLFLALSLFLFTSVSSIAQTEFSNAPYSEDKENAEYPFENRTYIITPDGEKEYDFVIDKEISESLVKGLNSYTNPSSIPTKSELLFLRQQLKEIALERQLLGLASSTYGAALPYQNVTSSTVNCYGYARYLSAWMLVGQEWGSVVSAPSSVSTVAQRVIYDLQSCGLGARVISGGLDSINANEYRAAVRVAYHPEYSSPLNWDYHFMVQTNVGTWGEKPGAYNSRNRGAIDPANANWYLYDPSTGTTYNNYYNSSTIFLAVRLF